jgi:hypothetical protein
MRSTLILIKREIEDCAIPFVVAAIVSGGTAILTYWEYGPLDPRSSHEIPGNVLGILLSTVSGLALLAVIMGAIQMAGDRMMGISSFLATLAPTRAQIFRAKCLAGLLWIVLALLPLFLVHGYTLMERDLDASLLRSFMSGSFLLLLTGYGLGLQLGLMQRTSWALITAVIVLTALFMLLLFILGLSRVSLLLFLLISVLYLARARSQFQTLSL